MTSVLFLLTVGSATAQAAKITGKAKPRSTVVAIAKDGRSWSAVAGPTGAFALSVNASPVTLQLRDPSGRYAGPIVAGGKPSKVFMGLRGAVKLGTLKFRGGAAFPAKPLPSRFIEKKLSAKAVKGVPVGAGKLGFGGTPGW